MVGEEHIISSQVEEGGDIVITHLRRSRSLQAGDVSKFLDGKGLYQREQ